MGFGNKISRGLNVVLGVWYSDGVFLGVEVYNVDGFEVFEIFVGCDFCKCL